MTSPPAQVKHRIKMEYSNLREKEKKVADYILNNADRIIHASISEVADNIEVADATVFRFCKKIGYPGYQAMKIALASDRVNGMEKIHELINKDDDEVKIAEKVFKSNISTLEETLEVLDPIALKRAVEAMVRAPKIAFFGNGGSGVTANDAHHKFMRIGLNTAAYTDPHLQLIYLSHMSKDDVVFLVSHSGRNKDILDTLQVAKQKGVTTVAITTLAKSPLSEEADIVLCTVSSETKYRSEALSSRLAQLSLIDALYVNVSIAKQEEIQLALDTMRTAVSSRRVDR